jgi:hypothetical protein
MINRWDNNEPSLEVLISRLDRAEQTLNRYKLTSSDRDRVRARRDTLAARIAETEDQLSKGATR